MKNIVVVFIALTLCVASSALSAASNTSKQVSVPHSTSSVSIPAAVNLPPSVATASSPLIVSIIKNPEETKEHASEVADQKTTDRWMLFSGVATSVLTAILAIATGFLASATRKLHIETKGLREDSIKQEKNTQRALGLSEAAAQMAQRLELPIFVVESISIGNNVDKHFTVKLGNHGRTPAIINAHCLTYSFERPKLLPQRSHSSSEVQPSHRIVEKGQVFDIVRHHVLDVHELSNIHTGAKKIWLYGYLDYTDFLKSKRQYSFSFRSQLVQAGSGTTLSWVQDGPPEVLVDDLISSES